MKPKSTRSSIFEKKILKMTKFVANLPILFFLLLSSSLIVRSMMRGGGSEKPAGCASGIHACMACNHEWCVKNGPPNMCGEGDNQSECECQWKGNHCDYNANGKPSDCASGVGACFACHEEWCAHFGPPFHQCGWLAGLKVCRFNP